MLKLLLGSAGLFIFCAKSMNFAAVCEALWLADERASTWLFSTNFRVAFLLLEWSIHGIPWLVGAATAVVLSVRLRWERSTQMRLAILLAGILLDLAIVGAVKVAARRNRPAYNTDDQVYEAPIADKFSFPSGHSSRAAMFAVFALTFYHDADGRGVARLLALAFPLVLALSRVMMGRHYVSDVLAGVALGVIEGFIALKFPPQFFDFCANVLNGVLDG